MAPTWASKRGLLRYAQLGTDLYRAFLLFFAVLLALLVVSSILGKLGLAVDDGFSTAWERVTPGRVFLALMSYTPPFFTCAVLLTLFLDLRRFRRFAIEGGALHLRGLWRKQSVPLVEIVTYGERGASLLFGDLPLKNREIVLADERRITLFNVADVDPLDRIMYDQVERNWHARSGSPSPEASSPRELPPNSPSMTDSGADPRALTESKTYDLGLNVVTITSTSLWIGTEEFLWQRIRAAGISYQFNGLHLEGSTPLLHFAYDDERSGKEREGILYLYAALPEVRREFVSRVRGLLGDRWVGEGKFLAMRKRLGFSNRGFVVLIVGTCVFFALVVVVVVVAAKSR